MEPEKKSNGALVGSIIIIIILVIGGIYLWGLNKEALSPLDSSDVTEADTAELEGLEADLGEVDTTLDADLEAIN